MPQMKLSVLYKGLGVVAYASDGDEVAYSPGADFAFSMQCLITICFAPPEEYDDYLLRDDIAMRPPVHNEDVLERNRRAFAAVMPPRGRPVPDIR